MALEREEQTNIGDEEQAFMQGFKDDVMLVQDREDLLAVLRMRFGEVPADVIQFIYEIDDYHQLQRLILTAANSQDWHVFIEELQAPSDTYKIVGERYNPLGSGR